MLKLDRNASGHDKSSIEKTMRKTRSIDDSKDYGRRETLPIKNKLGKQHIDDNVICYKAAILCDGIELCSVTRKSAAFFQRLFLDNDNSWLPTSLANFIQGLES